MQTETKQHLVEVKNLSVTYNQGKPNEFQSLKNISVRIYPEEFTIIFGPSGCGKSTLLYSISALQRPTEGEIFLEGASLTGMSKREQSIVRQFEVGMVFQSFYLIPSLNVLDNVCLPKVFCGESKKERRKEGMKLLERFGILEQADKYPSQLSGGQKQRVAIARCLINDPKIILADEPVGNLDSQSAENVLGILRDLKDIDKKAVVLVTHDPSHLERADRIFYMKDGLLVKEEVREGNKFTPVAKKESAKEEKSVPRELELLVRSFQGMPREYISSLLIPFKAQKVLFHLLMDIPEEQITLAQGFIKEYLFDKEDKNNLFSALDREIEDGGAGLDKRRAQTLSSRLYEMMHLARFIETESPERGSSLMREYMEKTFSFELDIDKKSVMETLLQKRIMNEISYEETLSFLDSPLSSGGVGLHKLFARKVAREIEMIMLLRY